MFSVWPYNSRPVTIAMNYNRKWSRGAVVTLNFFSCFHQVQNPMISTMKSEINSKNNKLYINKDLTCDSVVQKCQNAPPTVG